MTNPRFDHVGVTVSDLDEAIEFFRGLGLEPEDRASIEGEFIDTVCGIPGSRTEIVMMRPPGGQVTLELARWVHPEHEPGSADAPANVLGLRNVCFEVDDLPAVLERLASQGYGLVGGMGTWQDTWRMAYVRGPDGIVVSLSDRVG